MRHSEWTERLDALRTGELEEADAVRLRRHVMTCVSCRSTQKLLEALATLGKGVDAPPSTALREKLGDGYGIVETRLGNVWVAFTARGEARLVDLDVSKERLFEARYRKRYGRRVYREVVPAKLAESLRQAVAGEPFRSVRWTSRSVLRSSSASFARPAPFPGERSGPTRGSRGESRCRARPGPSERLSRGTRCRS